MTLVPMQCEYLDVPLFDQFRGRVVLEVQEVASDSEEKLNEFNVAPHFIHPVLELPLMSVHKHGHHSLPLTVSEACHAVMNFKSHFLPVDGPLEQH